MSERLRGLFLEKAEGGVEPEAPPFCNKQEEHKEDERLRDICIKHKEEWTHESRGSNLKTLRQVCDWISPGSPSSSPGHNLDIMKAL